MDKWSENYLKMQHIKQSKRGYSRTESLGKQVKKAVKKQIRKKR